MKLNIIITLCCYLFIACTPRVSENSNNSEPTPQQQALLDEGWVMQAPASGDISEQYGVQPIYGMQDNYFDVEVGKGINIALKIMSVETGECVRYAFVNENTTATIQEIPQGAYYLKIAYGYDWMILDDGIARQGKFTLSPSYERSKEQYDFGTKNSQETISWKLSIGKDGGALESNFETVPISEEEFFLE